MKRDIQKTSKKRSRRLPGFFLVLPFYLGVSICLSPVGVFAAKDFSATVRTQQGWMKGYVSDGAIIWRGVPYAAPPVGELRWKAPREASPWRGVRSAVSRPSACTQLATTEEGIRTGKVEGCEDCLYLNIYRPQRLSSPKEKLPVYVWIHGGANYKGSMEDFSFDGKTLAKRSNMVVVAIQYRLGPMGWLYQPALRTRGADPLTDSGNFGTLDTVCALNWIQKNIAAFGGDPRRVLITGESAGAHNVMNLVISPLGKGLFQRAMSQSGGMQTMTAEVAQKQANFIVEQLIRLKEGLDQVAAEQRRITMEKDGILTAYLRKVDAQDFFLALYKYDVTWDYPAVNDGAVMPVGGWIPAIKAGKYNKVPIILGGTESESKLFMPRYGSMVKQSGIPSGDYTWSDLPDVLGGKLKADGGPLTIEDVLPSPMDRDFYRDAGFFGSRNWRAKYVDTVAHELSLAQNAVYAYLFRWGEDGSGSYPFSFVFGAAHAWELSFFFGTKHSLGNRSYSGFTQANEAGRKDLQDAIMAYIAQFARTGDPNPPKSRLPRWGKWTNGSDSPKMIVFDADFEKAKIGMSNAEMTVEGVTAEMKAAMQKYPRNYRSAAQIFQFSRPWNVTPTQP